MVSPITKTIQWIENNIAARTLTGSKREDHVTPLLKGLH